MADIALFYEGHGKSAAAAAPKAAPAPSTKVAELLNKGGCIACHGDNFNKPVDPSYPKVGGQPADYLFVALKSYKVEGQATWGRANGIMGGIAKTVPQSKFR
jgi:cytochrome c553